jgi:hypothetical protein
MYISISVACHRLFAVYSYYYHHLLLTHMYPVDVCNGLMAS